MKFAVALTLASTAMAGMVVRDGQTVLDVISTVKGDLGKVTDAANAYKGDKTDLVKAADQLVSDLKDGKTKVDNGGKLTAEDALNLTTPVQGLTDAGTALTDALTSRKADVEKAGECKTVQDQISAISSASNDLINSVVSQVPTAAQGIAKDLAGKLTTVLQKAQDSFKDCQDASSGGSSTGSGSATGTSTGTGSATATGSSTGASTPTGSGSATATHSSATSTGGVKPTSTQVTIPTGAAAVYAPAAALAAVAAALAL